MYKMPTNEPSAFRERRLSGSPRDYQRSCERGAQSQDGASHSSASAAVLTGGVRVRADDREQEVTGERALMLYGDGGRVTFVVAKGSFIMNER